jgi:hypothetical protein
MEEYSFTPSQIFSADKTGVLFVHVSSKVLSVGSKKQVGKIASGEEGS